MLDLCLFSVKADRNGLWQNRFIQRVCGKVTKIKSQKCIIVLKSKINMFLSTFMGLKNRKILNFHSIETHLYHLHLLHCTWILEKCFQYPNGWYASCLYEWINITLKFIVYDVNGLFIYNFYIDFPNESYRQNANQIRKHYILDCRCLVRNN